MSGMTTVSHPGRQRLAAYGVVQNEAGAVLLVRASAGSNFPGRWFFPGGGVEFGEHPQDAVAREFVEETGLRVQVGRIRTVHSDLWPMLPDDESLHHVSLVYQVSTLGGALRVEEHGTSDGARWVNRNDLQNMDLMPVVALVLARGISS